MQKTSFSVCACVQITESTKMALEKLVQTKISAAMPVRAAEKQAPSHFVMYVQHLLLVDQFYCVSLKWFWLADVIARFHHIELYVTSPRWICFDDDFLQYKPVWSILQSLTIQCEDVECYKLTRR